METAGAARRPLLERRGVFLAAIGLLIALGLAAELRSYPGADAGFLLDEAARVLGGARLYADLVEMNPPLIVGINMAAVLCARAFGLSEIVAYRLGCIAAVLAVAGSCCVAAPPTAAG